PDNLVCAKDIAGVSANMRLECHARFRTRRAICKQHRNLLIALKLRGQLHLTIRPAVGENELGLRGVDIHPAKQSILEEGIFSRLSSQHVVVRDALEEYAS